MSDDRYELHPIGWVQSSLTDRDAAPNQGEQGSPDAWTCSTKRSARD